MTTGAPGGIAAATLRAHLPQLGTAFAHPRTQGPIQLRDDVPLPEEHVGQQPDEEEEEEAVSDEDLAFVQQHSESLGFLKNLDKAELDRWAPRGRCWAGLGSQQEGDDWFAGTCRLAGVPLVDVLHSEDGVAPPHPLLPPSPRLRARCSPSRAPKHSLFITHPPPHAHASPPQTPHTHNPHPTTHTRTHTRAPVHCRAGR